MTPHSDAQRDELAAACLRALDAEDEETQAPTTCGDEDAVSSEPIEGEEE